MARTVDPAKHEAKRQQILGAAYRCFARKGFAGTTTADLCKAAGMSAGNLFYYFPDKGAIFRAIFEADARVGAQLHEAAASGDPWGGLLGHLERTLDDAADPDAGGFMLAVMMQAQADPELAALLDRNDREQLAGLEALLARAAELGQVSGGVPPETGARWLATVLDGVFLRLAGDPGFNPSEHLPALKLLASRFLGAEEDKR